jgi:hypothetical protein
MITDPFFPVKVEKVITESGIPIHNRLAILGPAGDLLGITSNEYQVILNSTIDKLFCDALMEKYPYKVISDHIDAIGRRWRRRILFDKLDYDIEWNGSSLKVILEIFNSYDVRSGFGYSLMGYNPVCDTALITDVKESFYHLPTSPGKLLINFEERLSAFDTCCRIWHGWSRFRFSGADLRSFIQDRYYLNKRTREEILSTYTQILNRYKMGETRWGAFNVFSYLAEHETNARIGSHLFSNKYRTLTKLICDFCKI